jgi:hypothetical protein
MFKNGRTQEFLDAYPYKVRFGCVVIHTRLPLPEEAKVTLCQIVTSGATRRRSHAQIQCKDCRIFVKREQIDTFKKKVRINFNLVRTGETFDHPIEELKNCYCAETRDAPVAPLLGYGYKNSHLGIIDETYILTVLMTRYLTAKQMLSFYRNDTSKIIRSAFILKYNLNKKGIFHLDFWLGNIMIAENFSARAIDLEHCIVDDKKHYSSIIGYQFGHLYRLDLHFYIPENVYDRHVRAAVKLFYKDVEKDKFDYAYNVSKHERLSRVTKGNIDKHIITAI